MKDASSVKIAEVRIRNQVLRRGKIETLSTELELPCETSIIAHALQELGVNGSGENGWMEVSWIEPYGNEISMSGYERSLNHIYELNHLAERIASLDNADMARFQALCGRYLDAGSAYPEQYGMFETTFASAINMLHNISDNIRVIPNVSSDKELGCLCVEQQMVSGFENAGKAVLRYLDYKKIGADYREQANGVFYHGHLVCSLPERENLKLPYEGKELLIEPGQEASGEITMSM